MSIKVFDLKPFSVQFSQRRARGTRCGRRGSRGPSRADFHNKTISLNGPAANVVISRSPIAPANLFYTFFFLILHGQQRQFIDFGLCGKTMITLDRFQFYLPVIFAFIIHTILQKNKAVAMASVATIPSNVCKIHLIWLNNLGVLSPKLCYPMNKLGFVFIL